MIGTDPPSMITTIGELRSRLDDHRAAGRSVGFVPTMGYLHDGHGSLMRRASGESSVVVASLFVNPLQFAPDEDLDSYPRDLERDRQVAAENGVDLIFSPTVGEMYPNGRVLTTVSVAELSETLEGASRPTHFAGVATVVTKLLSIIGPCRAYFGEKDYQQLAIIRRMVADLSLPAEIVGCAIVREPDGLAMSSRNVNLRGDHRRAATVLHRALDAGATAIAGGERSGPDIEAVMGGIVGGEPAAELDYAAAVDAATLTRSARLSGEVRLLLAVRVGTTRLIDNRGVTVDSGEPMGAL